MPDELTLELDELDVLAIELADDARAPRLREAGELLCDVDLVHAHSLPPGVSWTTALERVQDPERERREQLYGSEFHVGSSLRRLWRSG